MGKGGRQRHAPDKWGLWGQPPCACGSGHAASAPQADEVGGRFPGTGSGDTGKNQMDHAPANVH